MDSQESNEEIKKLSKEVVELLAKRDEKKRAKAQEKMNKIMKIRNETEAEVPEINNSEAQILNDQYNGDYQRKQYPKEMILPDDRDKDDLPAFDIVGKKRISISKYQGKFRIDIREYYESEKGLLPTKKGVSLSLEDYALFKQILPSIDHELEVAR